MQVTFVNLIVILLNGGTGVDAEAGMLNQKWEAAGHWFDVLSE